jgi:colicin import membrane protein
VVTDNFIFAFIKSFGLHIFIGVALVASVSFKAADKPKPRVIQVDPIASVAVDSDKLAKQVKRIKTEKANQKKAEEKRVADLEARARRAKKSSENEKQRIKRLNREAKKSKDAKRKSDKAAKDAAAATKKAQQKQKRENAKAKQAEAQAKVKQQEKVAADKALQDIRKKHRDEEASAEKARADRLRKEKLAKEKKAAEAKRKKDEKAKREKLAIERAEQDAELARQMAQEQASRNAAHKKKVLGEVDKYKALIHQRITQRLIIDETMRGKSCRLNIKLAFNGLVTSVKILSGDKRLCNAAESAVLKAGKLPVSEDPAVFSELRNINLTFDI